jgi:capsular exopolysaccharide synthesis family protein
MQELERENNIDIKSIFSKFISNWYIFLISIIICVGLAYIFNRYSKSVYSINSTLILLNANNNQNLLDFSGLEDFNLGKNKSVIENEIAKLSSNYLIEKNIFALESFVNYFIYGKIRKDEVYVDNLSFYLEFDYTKPQCINNEIKIKLIDDNNINVTFNVQGSAILYNFSDKTEELINQNFKESKNYKFDEVIENQFFKFRIRKNNKITSLISPKSYNDIGVILEHPEEKILSYKSKTKVEKLNKEASVIKITIESSNPYKEIKYLNNLSKIYLEEELMQKNLFAEKSITFIENELMQVSDSLAFTENSLENYRSKNKILDLSSEARELVEYGARLDEQKRKENLIFQNLTEIESYLTNNLETKITPSIENVNDPMLTSMLIELSKNQTELNTRSLKIKDPKYYLDLSNRVSSLKSDIITNIQNLKSNSKNRLQSINEEINIYNSKVSKLPMNEKNLVSLKRRFTFNEGVYNFLITKKIENQLLKAANVPDARVLDEANLFPKKPIKPRKTIIYIFSIILGFIIPLIYYIIVEQIKDTVSGKKDIEKLSKIPIIGMVGHNKYDNNLPVFTHPKSAMAESFRALRASLKFLTGNADKAVIATTSTISGEGKTFISMNLASIFALSNYKTILIGSDLRKPRIYGDFKLDNNVGLSQYLSNNKELDEVIIKSEFPNLDLIVSGPIPPNPSELIESHKMVELVEELKKRYDYVIIDTAPLGLVSDSLEIMKLTNINFYVVRQNYTKKSMVNNLNDQVEANGIKNMYFIVNDYNSRKDSYGYGYGGYGYGYGYGYGGYGYGGYGYYGGKNGNGYYEEGKTTKKSSKIFGLIPNPFKRK